MSRMRPEPVVVQTDLDAPRKDQWLGLACLQRLQFFARLESDCFSRRDIHLLACARVSAYAGLARANAEDAEAAQLDPFTPPQSLLQRIKDGFHGLLCLVARDFGLLHGGIHDVEFDHTTLRIFCKCMLDRGLQVVKRAGVY